MTPEELKNSLDLCEQLERAWGLLIETDETPSIAQFQLWTSLHSDNLPRLLKGLSKLSRKSEKYKSEKGVCMTLDHATRFMSSICNTEKTLEEENEMTNENTEAAVKAEFEQKVAQRTQKQTQRNPLPRLPEMYHVEKTEQPRIASNQKPLTPDYPEAK